MKPPVNPLLIGGILLVSLAFAFVLHRVVRAADPAIAPVMADEANALATKIEKSIKIGDSSVFKDLLDDDATLDDFESVYPDDPSLLLTKIDSLYLSKQYDAVIAVIDRLDQRIGGDAYLGYLRGTVRLAQGRLEDARTLGVAATHLEPTLRQPWDLLIAVSVKAKDNAETVRLLDESSNATGVYWTKIGTARLFADFVKSPEYAEWVKSHPQNAGNLGPKPDELRLN
jgi:hypothetical protein